MKEDPGFYDYWPYDNRPKIEWPNGAKMAFWVAPNIEYYEIATNIDVDDGESITVECDAMDGVNGEFCRIESMSSQ